MLGAADVEEVGVCGCQWPRGASSRVGGGAVGHADRAAGAVVVAGAKASCGVADPGVDGECVEEPELSGVEDRVVLVGGSEANQVSGTSPSPSAVSAASPAAESARRAAARAASVSGPRPAYLP